MKLADLNRSPCGRSFGLSIVFCLMFLLGGQAMAGQGPDNGGDPRGSDSGTLQGTVTGLGYCNSDPSPLAGAMIFVDGQDDFFAMTMTEADGSYSVEIEETASPVDIMVVMSGYQSANANGVEVGPEEIVTVDLELLLGAPCATATPESFNEVLSAGDSAQFDLTIGNIDGLSSLEWEAVISDSDCNSPGGADWLSITPESGPIDAGDSTTATVHVDTTGLNTGDQEALICIEIDHDAATLIEVPFNLTTTGGDSPVVDIQPESVELNIEMGQSTTRTLEIANLGAQSLHWEIDPDGLQSSSRIESLKGGALLVVDGDGQIFSMDPETGDVIDGEFIEFDVGGGLKDQALLHPALDRVLMTHQTGRVVHSFGPDGDYLGVFAPAGGQDPEIMETVRGMAIHPQTGNLLVASLTGGNPNSIIEFDHDGEYLGNFIESDAGGLVHPWGILVRENDILVSANGSGAIHRYTLEGEPDGIFAEMNFPRQMFELENGNILVANTSGSPGAGLHELDAEGNQIDHYSIAGAARGVYELGNGNILISNSTGVHEINRENGMVDTKYTGAHTHFITYVDALNCTLPTWMTLDNLSGSIDAGDPAQSVTMTLNAAELEPGLQTGSICVESNDPEKPLVEVPVSMTVDLPPNYATLEGTVSSAGYCGEDPSPLHQATVVISTGSGDEITLTTDRDGFYETYMPDSQSPLSITVSSPGQLPVTIDDIAFDGGQSLVEDFPLALDAPCATVDSDPLNFSLQLGESASASLMIGNLDGGADLSWEIDTAQGYRQTNPRAHFPTVPYIRESGSTDGLMDTELNAGSFDSLSDRVVGDMQIPTYGIATSGFNDYVVFDALAPGELISIVNPRPAPVHAMTFVDYDFSRHYFMTGTPGPGNNQPPNSYGYVDTETGEVTILGTLSGSPSNTPNWSSMTWDRTTNTVFAVASATLYTVDLEHGIVELVGPIQGEDIAPNPIIITTAVSPDGLLYGLDIVANVLIAIDKTDGTSAPIGPLGVNPNHAQDMDFDHSTGELYWAAFAGAGSGQMATINTETGEASPIGAIEGGAEIVAMSIAIGAGGCNDPQEADWLSVEPAAGTVAAGGMETIAVNVDSTNLHDDVFEAFLCITTGDTNASSFHIPVELTVNDPDAGTLEGTVTGAGHCGSDPQPLPGALVTIQGSDSVFHRTTDADGYYHILLNEGQTPLEVSVSAEGHVEALATGIEISASTTSTVDFNLDPELGCTDTTTGELTATLGAGNSTTQTLTLTNSGVVDSSFELTTRSVTGPIETIQIERPGRDTVELHSESNSRTVDDGMAREPHEQTIFASQGKDVISVLVVSPDGLDVTPPLNLLDDLNMFPDIDAAMLDASALTNVTVDDLIDYDVVVTSNNRTWAGAGADYSMGNALADYVDLGGFVILHSYALDAVFSPPEHYHLMGRYIDEDYAPMTLSTGDVVADAAMVPLVPSHRLFDNVGFVHYGSGFRNTNHSVTSGAQLMAEWDDGVPMLAMNEHSIYINALYSNTGVQGPWTGDLNILLHNAIHELAGVQIGPADWIDFEIYSGVVPAQGNIAIGVTFSAEPEIEKGVYEAEVLATVDDGEGYFNIVVPASMTVVELGDSIFSDRFEQ